MCQKVPRQYDRASGTSSLEVLIGEDWNKVPPHARLVWQHLGINAIEETVAVRRIPDVFHHTLVGLISARACLVRIEPLPHQIQVALHGGHVARSVLGLLVGQELFEAEIVVVVAVDAVDLAMNGQEDAVVVVAGRGRVVVVPVVASPSDITTVEQLGTALCGTGDVALVVVPVVGPAVDCSLM